jgi:hypothetical protein
MNGLKEPTTSTPFDERIESEFYVDPVEKDGNCLFGMAEKATGFDKSELRQAACNYELNNQEQFIEFVSTGNGSLSRREKKRVLFNHVERMKKTATWGGSFEVFALAQILEHDINVWTSGGLQTIPYLGDGTKDETIDCRLKNSHYDYLIPRETGTVHQSGRNSDDSTSYPSVGGKVVSAQKNKEQGQKSLARLQQEQQEPDRLQREEQEQQLESKKRTKSEQRGSTRSRELTRLISSYNDGTVTPSSGSVSTRLQTKRRG